jgi:hypothetical protein
MSAVSAIPLDVTAVSDMLFLPSRLPGGTELLQMSFFGQSANRAPLLYGLPHEEHGRACRP